MKMEKQDPTVKVCMTIKESMDKKIRNKQVSNIMKYGSNYSYSKTMNDILEEYFK